METTQFSPGDQVRVKTGEQIEGKDISGEFGTIVAGPRDHPVAGPVYVVDLGEPVVSQEVSDEAREKAEAHVQEMREAGQEPAGWRFDDIPTAPNRVLLTREELLGENELPGEEPSSDEVLEQALDQLEAEGLIETVYAIGDRVKFGEFPMTEVFTRDISGEAGTVRGSYTFELGPNHVIGLGDDQREAEGELTIYAVELDEPFMSDEDAQTGLTALDFAEMLGGPPSPRTCFPDLDLDAIGGRIQFADAGLLEPLEEGTETE